MKEIIGYLIDRTTGAGISGKAVAFKNLAGSPITTATTYAQVVDALTDSDGRFRGRFELSPGPVNIDVTVSGSEKKIRKWDEKSQIGAVWNSDLHQALRASKEGVISGYLNQLAVTIPSGHTIRIATGAANINGNVFSVELGNLDVAGTANANAALNPRLDLVTLRQYNVDAPGQDAGRQEVVVTLGTSQNVEPALPTGSTFKDLPLAVVSTAFGASTKTVTRDARVYTGSSGITAPLLAQASSATATRVPLTTSYATIVTPTVTGLTANKIYDGRVVVQGTLLQETQNQNVLLATDIRLNSSFMYGGAYTKTFNFAEWDVEGNSQDFKMSQPIAFEWPIVGVTGMTSFPLAVEMKGVAGSNIYEVTAFVVLNERK